MDFENYKEGQSMQRPPLFEANGFIYWKNRFETYVKSKDIDIWYIIIDGDNIATFKDTSSSKDEDSSITKHNEDQKKLIAKNNEAKMMIYNALPKKEYERVFTFKTAKEIWQSLIVTHQGNLQVKDNKIDLFIQQYEQFSIPEDEIIDCAFARFNTIITSLKALDESFCSKNFVRKFLRALHPKWRAKVTVIEESKDISSMSLEELIGNLKVHEMVMEKDSEIVRKKEKVNSIALKARVQSSDNEESSSDSDDEEYAIAVRDFKKFFRRRGKFVRQPKDDKKAFQKDLDDKKGKVERKCFRCGDTSHLIGECPKPPKSKSQKAFVSGAWSDSEDDDEEPKNDDIALMAHDSNEVHSDSSCSSIDDDTLQKEYNKLCELSLKIINKNKFLKTKKEFLENEVYELKEKAKKLEKSKSIDTMCKSCQEFKLEIEKLKITQNDLIKQTTNFKRFDKSISCADEIMKLQKSPFDKTVLGFLKSKTLKSQTKLDEKAQETNQTTTGTHGPDGTKNLVSSVEPKGSAGPAAEKLISTSDRTKFVKVTNRSKTSVNDTKLKPAIKIGVGLGKNEFRTKTTQTRPKTPIPKRPFPKSSYNTQPNYQHGWNQNIPRGYRTPNYMSWNPYVPFSYMDQVNGMFNQNGPMRYWGPKVHKIGVLQC